MTRVDGTAATLQLFLFAKYINLNCSQELKQDVKMCTFLFISRSGCSSCTFRLVLYPGTQAFAFPSTVIDSAGAVARKCGVTDVLTPLRIGIPQQWIPNLFRDRQHILRYQTSCGSRGPWGPGFPLAPKISSNFKGKNPILRKILGSGPPLGSKLCWAPLTKILDPPLQTV